MYKFLADSVVVLHMVFILFAVSGGLLALKWPKIIYAHIPAVLWGAYIEFSGGICPLTPLEVKWRIAAGQEGYAGDFIGRYLLPIIYPAELTRDMQLILGVTLLLINGLAYGWLWWNWRRHKQQGTDCSRLDNQ
jgi:hypothetical protein